MKRWCAERILLVPEYVVDQALETNLDNSTFFEDWGENTQYQLPSLDDHKRIMVGMMLTAYFTPNDRMLQIRLRQRDD